MKNRRNKKIVTMVMAMIFALSITLTGTKDARAEPLTLTLAGIAIGTLMVIITAIEIKKRDGGNAAVLKEQESRLDHQQSDESDSPSPDSRAAEAD